MLAHYVAQTHSNQERTARDEIDSLGYQVTWFVEHKEYRTKTGRRVQTVSILPCYIFVYFDIVNHEWEEITKCRGVKRLLGSDPSNPEPLRHGAVWELKQRFDAREFKPSLIEPLNVPISVAPRAPIEVGQMVLVDDGGAQEKLAKCTMSEKDKLRVMMSYFGREIEVKVSRDRVRAA